MINIKALLGLNYYTSELDLFLKHFDKTHPKQSTSQQAEIKKYTRIYQLRDNPSQTKSASPLWDKF